MKQYDKTQIDKFLLNNGYRYRGGVYTKNEGMWDKSIWIQSGVSGLSGKFTVNFYFINNEILSFANPDVKPGKGNSVLTIRIGEFLSVGDKWYSSITPFGVPATTDELLTDLGVALVKFEAINSDELIAKCLWERNNLIMSCFVMALYLEHDDIVKIISNLGIRQEFKHKIFEFSKARSNNKISLKSDEN
jgi:hypothetical protein